MPEEEEEEEEEKKTDHKQRVYKEQNADIKSLASREGEGKAHEIC
jgi:hypothetical protein